MCSYIIRAYALLIFSLQRIHIASITLPLFCFSVTYLSLGEYRCLVLQNTLRIYISITVLFCFFLRKLRYHSLFSRTALRNLHFHTHCSLLLLLLRVVSYITRYNEYLLAHLLIKVRNTSSSFVQLCNFASL